MRHPEYRARWMPSLALLLFGLGVGFALKSVVDDPVPGKPQTVQQDRAKPPVEPGLVPTKTEPAPTESAPTESAVAKRESTSTGTARKRPSETNTATATGRFMIQAVDLDDGPISGARLRLARIESDFAPPSSTASESEREQWARERYSLRESNVRTARTGPDGAFTFEIDAESLYSLTCEKAGYVFDKSTMTIGDGDMVEVVGRRVARLTITSPDRESMDEMRAQIVPAASGRPESIASGVRYELSPGPYRVRLVGEKNGCPARSEWVSIDLETDRTLSLRFEAKRSLRVVVVDPRDPDGRTTSSHRYLLWAPLSERERPDLGFLLRQGRSESVREGSTVIEEPPTDRLLVGIFDRSLKSVLVQQVVELREALQVLTLTVPAPDSTSVLTLQLTREDGLPVEEVFGELTISTDGGSRVAPLGPNRIEDGVFESSIDESVRSAILDDTSVVTASLRSSGVLQTLQIEDLTVAVEFRTPRYLDVISSGPPDLFEQGEVLFFAVVAEVDGDTRSAASVKPGADGRATLGPLFDREVEVVAAVGSHYSHLVVDSEFVSVDSERPVQLTIPPLSRLAVQLSRSKLQRFLRLHSLQDPTREALRAFVDPNRDSIEFPRITLGEYALEVREGDETRVQRVQVGGDTQIRFQGRIANTSQMFFREDHPLASAGFRSGDVLLEIEGAGSLSGRQLERKGRGEDGGAFRVVVLRGDTPHELSVEGPQVRNCRRGVQWIPAVSDRVVGSEAE